MNQIGFKDLKIISISPVKSKVPTTNSTTCPNFYSITVRAFKVTDQEDRCEDYQNTAVYAGGITDFEDKFEFDQHYKFAKNCPVSVCKNTADILRKSRFAPFFEVSDDKSHTGLHPVQSFELNLQSASGSAGCCPEKSGKLLFCLFVWLTLISPSVFVANCVV